MADNASYEDPAVPEHTMQIFTCLLGLFLLFGCTSHTPNATSLDLQLTEQGGGVYSNRSNASIHGKDLRPQAEVIFYNLQDAAFVKLANSTPPHELITGRLAAAFQQQGLQLAVDAPVTLTLEIHKLQAVVTHPKALYKTDVYSSIRFIVNNRGSILTKNYTREAAQESLMRPDLQDIESMLQEQITEILELIVSDTQIKSLIRKNA